MKFIIAIADRKVEIDAMYESTREYCKNYLSEGTPDVTIWVTEEEIAYEREKTKREAELEGHPFRDFSNQYYETLAVYRKLVVELLAYDTMLMHGSVIAVDGIGYLFTAKSGTGKSTHTRLWREYFGDRAVMINDDKPLLRVTEEGVYAYGTPWDGKHHLSTNTVVPLKAICILERSETNQIQKITPIKAFPMLMQQCYRPKEADKLQATLTLIEKIIKTVGLYRLGCNMDPEAVKVSYEGMNQ
ncbi:MAG: hypothetical protein MJ114_03660 [Acetatifactor sp.]|nr:hypothetical protein [Acetatifactor sp.]